jgi:hypothetical protein
MKWLVPRIWDGGDVYILGGGPSVTKQFNIPEDIVKKVIEGSASPSIYSPYMSFLHDKHVIGVNVAYLIGTWIDMIFFGDSGFLSNHQKGLSDFPGLKISCHPITDSYPWIKYLVKEIKHQKGISTHRGLVSWNYNSGAAAISVAAHAGAKRILLLGFDMKLNDSQCQHWHDVYHRRERLLQKHNIGLPFERHLRGFPEIAKDARKMGIEIINLCPNSAISQFPKMSVDEWIIKLQSEPVKELEYECY